jgi:tRNA (guanine37-N1)-methyltransferase
MKFDILTLFPEFFSSFKETSIIKNAIRKKLISIKTHNIRSYAKGKHKVTDDAPFGGGSGMVMKAEPILSCLEKIKTQKPESTTILLSPKGITFSQELAKGLAKKKSITLICPRYEGVDERVMVDVDMELSIGDYIISGGEGAAMIVVDAVSRMIDGVLGNKNSLDEESFNEFLLEYPQFTRPEVLPGPALSQTQKLSSLASQTGSFHLLPKREVPKVLLSGNHELIKKWRRQKSIIETLKKRPDLLKKANLTKEDKKFLKKYMSKKLSIDELKFIKGELDE